MRKNTARRNPEEKDIKNLEDQDPMDTGQRNYARVARDSKEGINTTQDKNKKNDDTKHEEVRNYLGLELAHNFLIY